MPMPACAPLPRSFLFGPFLLQPERQLLLMDDKPVRIGGRALDLLTALVERPGQVLSKRELVSRTWPNLYVEDYNLKVNMASLRRVLGETYAAPLYIATVTGRGYRFIAPVETFGIVSGAPGETRPSAAVMAANAVRTAAFGGDWYSARPISIYASYTFRMAATVED